MYCDVLGCSGIFWDVMDVLGCTGMYWNVLECTGIFWDVLGILGCSLILLDVLGLETGGKFPICRNYPKLLIQNRYPKVFWPKRNFV